MWASVVGLIHRPPVALMCLFMFTVAHSQTFFITAGIVTGVRNFGGSVGTTVGILEGYLGLSGAVLIQVYDTIFKGNPSTFLLILAFCFDNGCLSHDYYSLGKHFHFGIMGTHRHIHISAASTCLTSWNRIQSPVGGLREIINIITNKSPTEKNSLVYNPEPITSHDPMAYHELPPADDDAYDQEKATFDDNITQNDQEDMNIQQAMCTGNFWLLFIAMICGMGSGLATINNISQVGESLGYTTIEKNSLVSLLSIWNFLGRFGAGLSDIFLHKRGWARPLFIVFTQAALSAGHIIVAVGFPGNLYVGSIIVGICYGSQWSLMPTITSEIFGVGHMGTIYNTIAVASPVGSYIFSVRIIGYIYDMAASGEDNSCSGSHCFMLSFLIMACFALFGCLVALLLYFRTRRFYDQVVLKRLRHEKK
ncbi:hypothetical protein ACOSP7_024348 [Xanthoceras sorbifolium]